MINGIVNIESGFSAGSLVTFKELADSLYIVIGDNPYLEVVNIPAYDAENPEHMRIVPSLWDNVNTFEWTSLNLNNTAIKHFYIEEGDYSGVTITLTASGTVSDRRSISLWHFTGRTTHPASLAEADQANIRIKFDGGSYWDIDRMSNIDQTAQVDVTWFQGGATNNVINRLNYENFYSGIIIGASLTTPNNYNTIQNTYLNGMTYEGRLSDNIGIVLVNSSLAGLRTIGTKIINNDIKNCNDSIQLVRSNLGNVEDVAFNGTIIDSNRLWVDNTIYYDDTLANGGVLDINGMYSLSENGIDFKAGSSDPQNPVICTNNKMWGFRQNVQGSGRGGCSGMQYGVYNVNFDNNILFDSERGIALGNVGIQTHSAEDCTFRNNIFHQNNVTTGDVFVVGMANGNNITVEYNSIIDNAGGYGAFFDNNDGTTNFDNNLAITAGQVREWSATVSANDNYLYETTDNISGVNTINGGVASNANMTDYSFQYDVFTLSPKTKTLTGVVSTITSPHYGVAGSDIVN